MYPPPSRLLSLHRSLRLRSRQYLPPFLLRHQRHPPSPHPLHRPHAGAHWQHRSVLGRSVGRLAGRLGQVDQHDTGTKK